MLTIILIGSESEAEMQTNTTAH